MISLMNTAFWSTQLCWGKGSIACPHGNTGIRLDQRWRIIDPIPDESN
jgi:hypothetical protein